MEFRLTPSASNKKYIRRVLVMNAKPMIERLCLVLLAILVLTLTLPGVANAQAAGAVSREYLTLDGTESRAYSPAVATQGGKTYVPAREQVAI